MVFGLASGFCELHSFGDMDFPHILVPASCHHNSFLTCHYSPSGLLEGPQKCPAHTHLKAFALDIPMGISAWLPSSLHSSPCSSTTSPVWSFLTLCGEPAVLSITPLTWCIFLQRILQLPKVLYLFVYCLPFCARL